MTVKSFSRVSAEASESSVYIEDDNQDNIEKILEEIPNKKNRITNKRSSPNYRQLSRTSNFNWPFDHVNASW